MIQTIEPFLLSRVPFVIGAVCYRYRGMGLSSQNKKNGKRSHFPLEDSVFYGKVPNRSQPW